MSVLRKAVFTLMWVLCTLSQEFSCDITYTKPLMVHNGALLGQIYYSWSNANILLDFPASNSRPHFSELYSFDFPTEELYNATPFTDSQFIYRTGNCNDCEIGHLNSVMPIFDVSNPLFVNYFTKVDTVDECCVFNRKSHVLQPLVSTVVIGQYFPYSLTWEDGTQWNFTNCRNFTFPETFFEVPDSCTCGKALDIVFVIDTSESISKQEKIDQREFLKKFIEKFELSPTKVNIAIVQFSSIAWVSLTILEGHAQENVVTAITNLGCTLPCTDQKKSNSRCTSSDQTCCCGRSISAGVRMAADQLKLGRNFATKVLVVLTNGYHDTLYQYPGPGPECGTDQAACTQDLIDADSYIFSELGGNSNIGIFAVGIGSEILSEDELNIIADSAQKVLRRSSFSELSSDFMDLLSRVCDENSRPCGDCCGLCSCGTCFPPDRCLQISPCRLSTISKNGICCSDTTVTCTTGKSDACHTYICDENPLSTTAGMCITNSSISGGMSDFPDCFHRICDSNLPESIPHCENVTECTVANASLDCDDHNQCTIESCSSEGICTWQLIDCATEGYLENACVDVTCHPESGCRYVSKLEQNPRMCDDHNLCTSDYCDPSRGCVHEDIPCKDYNPCTVDTCDQFRGCIFVPISCVQNVSHKGLCGISSCHSGACNYRSVPCLPTSVIQASITPVIGTAGIISIVAASLLCLGGIIGCGVYATETTRKKSPNPVFVGSTPKRNPMYSIT